MVSAEFLFPFVRNCISISRLYVLIDKWSSILLMSCNKTDHALVNSATRVCYIQSWSARSFLWKNTQYYSRFLAMANWNGPVKQEHAFRYTSHHGVYVCSGERISAPKENVHSYKSS